jgi:hypothetical protein
MTDSGTVPGRRLDAALHLLDRQLIDPDGRMVAKVDDLELTSRPDGRLVVSAILTGPGALGPRLGGRFGHWVVAVWSRLHPSEAPVPGRLPMSEVVDIDSAVHVGPRRSALGVDRLERWAVDHLVNRIPGARDDPEQ